MGSLKQSSLSTGPADSPSGCRPGFDLSFAGMFSRPLQAFAALMTLLVICFGKPLFDWARYAAGSDLFSYVLLVPFVSLYLVWPKRAGLRWTRAADRTWGVVALCAGLAIMLGYWCAPHFGLVPGPSDRVTWTIFGFYISFIGVCLLCFASEILRDLAFPIGFLVFIVPFPYWFTDWITSFLQQASAVAAHLFFALSGMPVFKQDLVFQLPGMRLEVAPECSGIHSTLVLFITSVLAAQFFLRSTWSRAALALAVIPLGILRNGIRIWTIGELCVHIGPEMINSPIHRRGGPLFFVAALIPLFLLLYYLRKLESKKDGVQAVKA